MFKIRWIAVIFFVLFFSSCEKKTQTTNTDSLSGHEPQTIENNTETAGFYEPPLVKEKKFKGTWYDTAIIDTVCNEFTDIYQFSYYRNVKISENMRYFETVLNHETPLYKIDGDTASFILNLPAQTKITILSENNSRDDKYYLVKTNDDTNLWSGWIQSKFISDDVNAEIDNIPYGEKFLNTLLKSISTKNDILADHTSWMGEFIVVKNNGEIICRLQNEEIMEIEPDAGDGGIIGWSSNNERIWFDCNMDAYTACFGIIDINLKKYMILERPPSFGYQYEIDFDTGTIYYSDYNRFLFDQDSAKKTKQSGQIFHLYSYNFFTKEQTEIDTNTGEGFEINYNPVQGLTYEKSNYY